MWYRNLLSTFIFSCILLFDISGYAQNSNNYLLFEELDSVENYEDLSQYGVLPPEIKNHKAGKNLILLSIKATAFRKGDWVMTYGLLGASMLDVEAINYIAYRSLFLSLIERYKMHTSYILWSKNLYLIASLSPSKENSMSIITLREVTIFRISSGLTERFIYNAEGNFARNYLPETNRESNKSLKKALISGLEIYSQLEKTGFKDATLRDALGMAYASLDFDSVRVSVSDLYRLGALQVYVDALEATLGKLRKRPNHSYQFLEELGFEMSVRGLVTDEEILLPSNTENLNAILTIVANDLDSIKK